jgi:hypothetical protein
MKNSLILTILVLALAGCSASIGTPPNTTSTTYTTPAVTSTTYSHPVASQTTVTKTSY